MEDSAGVPRYKYDVRILPRLLHPNQEIIFTDGQAWFSGKFLRFVPCNRLEASNGVCKMLGPCPGHLQMDTYGHRRNLCLLFIKLIECRNKGTTDLSNLDVTFKTNLVMMKINSVQLI